MLESVGMAIDMMDASVFRPKGVKGAEKDYVIKVEQAEF